ncbi:hypothetical protein [Mesorhizobium loti]|uniref:hypothetical protein n=1 Tax=Rhizobium loti TaxID=381 RepID=UPI001FDA3763|nr:hypothetical protein [Mesorhizobium loti]
MRPEKVPAQRKKSSGRAAKLRDSTVERFVCVGDWLEVEPSAPNEVLWRGREEWRLDLFQKLEALIDSAGIDDVEQATALLRRFKGKSQPLTTAIDEFMLDFMTLVFVVETGEDEFEKPMRKLACTRLSNIRQLVNVPA